jgi:hypothetical protein
LVPPLLYSEIDLDITALEANSFSLDPIAQTSPTTTLKDWIITIKG